jgi:uncharacterized protein YndB with AHSA1/START domain
MMAVVEQFRIDRSVEVEAPIDRVWRALTDASQLSAWFQVTIEGAIAAGAEVWMTSVHPDHAGQRFKVRFLELAPPHRLVWAWHPGEIDPSVDYAKEPETTVTFHLEPTGTGTRLTVSETGFDRIAIARRAKVYRDNAQGWPEVLVWLQAYVQQGR